MQKTFLVSPVKTDSLCENRTVLNRNTSITPDFSSFYELPQPSQGFVSLDPRTFDSVRNVYLQLDKPPLYSSDTLPQSNLYCPRNYIHTGFYPNYQSIQGGNIKYYTDLTNDDPFGSPQFMIPCYNKPQLLIDPMGSVKPYYKRIPVFEHNNLKTNSTFEYSFLKDTSEFREDLTSLQNDKINRSDFGYFQLINDPSTYYPTYEPIPNYPLNN